MRTRLQIDVDYTETAKLYGDKQFRLLHLQEELKKLFQKMNDLSLEQASPPETQIPSETL